MDTDVEERLEEIRLRLAAATAGPWRVRYNRFGKVDKIAPESGETVVCNCTECSQDERYSRTYSVICETDSHVYGPTRQDAELIAHAPEDLAFLLGLLLDAQRAVKE